MSPKEPILIRRTASVTTIELNDPPYNRLSMALIDALEKVVGEVERDQSVRAVILRGAGNEISRWVPTFANSVLRQPVRASRVSSSSGCASSAASKP